MRLTGIICGVVCAATAVTGSARAQQPTIEELMKKLDALQRRVDELEGRQKAAAKPSPGAATRTAATPGGAAGAAPRPAVPAPAPAVPSPAVAATPAPSPPTSSPPPSSPADATVQQATAPISGLLAPEPMGHQFEDALRSDLPGISLRIPGADTEVRFYGFAKLSGYNDLNGRNQNNAPPPATIPLADSAAAQQGGDFGMTARFSRFGMDTRTLTGLGTLETRIEGDFGGGPAASNNLVFRLRQAWGELGTRSFRVLAGQANSLWNEGLFETLNDSTNLNQSAVRQAQLRLTGRLATGLTGQLSLEMPETQYISTAGVFTPESSLAGGPSPAFSALPDLLTRLTYRHDGLELDARGLLRQLSIRTAGTAAAPPAVSQNTVGWGIAAQARFPMRWLSEAFGADQFVGMGYYGQGIGRYFPGNSPGQDLVSSIGLPGTYGFSQDALPTYGFTAAYRRFWTPQWRSNAAYSYAHQDYPSYALAFTPGSAPATALNSDMQQAIVNLIWSPFATIQNGTVGTGWLDVGLEYIYTSRYVFGGWQATGLAGAGYGIANRIMGAVTVRF